MTSRHVMKLTGATALAILLTGAALAQGGPPSGERGWWGMWNHHGPGWGMGMGMGMRERGHWGGGPDWMLDRIEGRIAFMKTELKITEAQTSAWTKFAEAIRTASKHHNERMKSMFSDEQSAKTLPERIDAQEQFMSIRLEEIKLIKAALNDLYAVLSPEQKKEADEMMIPMVGMGRHWG
jgi:hypothetical protein